MRDSPGTTMIVNMGNSTREAPVAFEKRRVRKEEKKQGLHCNKLMWLRLVKNSVAFIVSGSKSPFYLHPGL